MSNNDQYPPKQGGTFRPVAIILLIAIAAVLGVFLYERSKGPLMDDGAPTVTTDPAANPNQLTPTSPPPAAN